jgi:hypothetical protein
MIVHHTPPPPQKCHQFSGTLRSIYTFISTKPPSPFASKKILEKELVVLNNKIFPISSLSTSLSIFTGSFFIPVACDNNYSWKLTAGRN